MLHGAIVQARPFLPRPGLPVPPAALPPKRQGSSGGSKSEGSPAVEIPEPEGGWPTAVPIYTHVRYTPAEECLRPCADAVQALGVAQVLVGSSHAC